MASEKSFVEFIADQMGKAGIISFKKMFGEYALYCDGIVIGLICDNQLYVKPTESGRSYIGNVIEAAPYSGAKPYFLIEEAVEDREWISGLIKATVRELSIPKPRRPPKKPDHGDEGRQEGPMKKVDYMKVAPLAMNGLKKGAFLTVKTGKRSNTMAIGWATFGVVWRRPILMIAVRTSRYTFELIEAADDFTVSIPSKGLKKEIAFCGSKSGRDHDKFKECGLKTKKAEKVKSPVIDLPGIHYECKIFYKVPMDPRFLDKAVDKALYPAKDYHTLYFGEVLSCYETE